jgi:recombination protein RecA
MLSSKSHLQSMVAAKLPQAFTLKKSEFLEVTATGIFPLDSIIQGLPRGGVTEIYGPTSSGRTTIAFSLLAQITRQQQICAIVDASDSFDPESLAAAGAELNQVLWVRCGKPLSGDWLSSANSNSCGHGRCSTFSTPRPLVLASRHPRNEVQGLSRAVAHFMGNESGDQSELCHQMVSPGNPASKRKGEQVSTDRLPSRREDFISVKPLRGGQAPGSFSQTRESKHPAKNGGEQGPPSANRQALWRRLEQALKVTDLLLHNGGFGAVIIDLGDVPPDCARRIPLTSWFRFRRAIENTPTALILLTCEPCAQTCASLVLRCERCAERWGHAAEATSFSSAVAPAALGGTTTDENGQFPCREGKAGTSPQGWVVGPSPRPTSASDSSSPGFRGDRHRLAPPLQRREFSRGVTLDGLDLNVEVMRQRFFSPQGSPQRLATSASWQTWMEWVR